MVKLPSRVIDNVFYLYEDEDSAKHGLEFGGTGFLVCVKSTRFPDGWVHNYAVTNWHVAKRSKASVIRLNRKDGTHRIIKATPDQWLTDEKLGYDIAVLPISLEHEEDRYAFVSREDGFLTKELCQTREIGPGEDVFMVGRFVDHDGGPVNKPAVRFGHISVMPTPLEQPTGTLADSYCIDMHSRSGYSGSPVWIYRSPGYDITTAAKSGSEAELVIAGNHLMLLLGIHYDQFPEAWPIVGETEMTKAVKRDGRTIRGLSGMTKVLPAWAISEVLDMPALVALREHQDGEIAKTLDMKSFGEANSSVAGKKEGEAAPQRDNPSHKEDFTRLLGAAVKANKPASET